MQTNTPVASGALSLSEPKSTIGSVNSEYTFHDGYPTPQTARQAYDDGDLIRAIEAYKFFFPSVAIAATWKGNLTAGAGPEQGFPDHAGKSPADRPDAQLGHALRRDRTSTSRPGRWWSSCPPGPLMCVVNDLNQRYVMDMGLPGPDGGKGGRHLLVPPGYTGQHPDGYSTSEHPARTASCSCCARSPHTATRSQLRSTF